MTPNTFRARRRSAGITGQMVCIRARIGRSKLSEIEAGTVKPSEVEMQKLETALSDLVGAQAKVRAAAAEAGWPSDRI